MNNLERFIRILSCALLVGSPPVAAAANLMPDAGAVLREQQQPTLKIPTRPTPDLQLEEPSRPLLPPTAGAHFRLKRISISGNTAFTEDELLVEVQHWVGQDLHFAELGEAVARLSRFYREHGYLVARAYLPAQDIKAGEVEIAILEGRYGKVDISNHSRVRDSVARAHVKHFHSTVVRAPALERKLLLLDDLAGVGNAHTTLRPGASVGESDAAFELTASPWGAGSVEYDNYGNHFIGANRLTGRLELFSPLQLGDQLSTRFTRGFDGLDYGYVNYRIPLGSDGFRLGGTYGASDYQLGKSFTPLNASGDSDTAAVNVSYPFIRTRNFSLYGEADYAWRSFQDSIGTTATVIDKHTRGATFIVSGNARDPFGGGGVTAFSIVYGNGRVDIKTPAARAIDSLSARTDGHFDKWNFNFLRLQSLSERTALLVAVEAQQASTNLDSSEKFILGGANGVRAYPQGEASGDSGYRATAELRYRRSNLWLPGVWQPFLFVDVGAVTLNEDPFALGHNRRHLAGAGVGLTWLEAHGVQATLTLATRLGNEHAISDTDSHLRGWVQLIKNF